MDLAASLYTQSRHSTFLIILPKSEGETLVPTGTRQLAWASCFVYGADASAGAAARAKVCTSP